MSIRRGRSRPAVDMNCMGKLYNKGRPRKRVIPNSYFSNSDGTTTLTIARRDGSNHGFLFDSVDFDWVQRRGWKVQANGWGHYIALSSPSLSLGRHVLRLSDDDPRQVTWLNGNRADNRRANLAAVTASEAAVRRHRDNQHGRNIVVRGGPKPFEVIVMRHRRSVYVGSYATLAEAQAARDAYLVSLGESCRSDSAAA